MYLIIKRLFDIIISLVGIIFLIPIILLIKILYIFTGDFKTIFYSQKRYGKNGKTFKIYKFRTMVYNSDELLKKYLKDKEFKKKYELAYKLDDDPRITKIGKILRVFSIDELPQFINVLKGEMSIIGPRPVIKKELNKYKKNKKLFLSVKPGLTGNWAINGRNNTTYEERINLELFYAKNISFKLDLKIFFKTFYIVIKRIGAK